MFFYGEMQKESKRIEEQGEWYKDKKQGLQKLIEGQEVQKKGELYWKEKCLDSQAQLLEVEKKSVEKDKELFALKETQLAEWENKLGDPGYIRSMIDKDPRMIKIEKESKKQTEELNAVIEGYKQDTAYSKAAQDACKYKEGVASGIAAVNKRRSRTA